MQHIEETFNHLCHCVLVRSNSPVPLTLKRRGWHREWIPGSGGSLESSLSLSTLWPSVTQVPPSQVLQQSHPIGSPESRCLKHAPVWPRLLKELTESNNWSTAPPTTTSLPPPPRTYGTDVTSHLPLRLTRPVGPGPRMAARPSPIPKGRTWAAPSSHCP